MNVTNVASADGVLKSTDFHSFSIGEPIVSKITDTNRIILTQGFLQSIGLYYLFANRDNKTCFTWKTWPVPANNIINVSLDHIACFLLENTELRILNVMGEIVASKKGLDGTNVFACDNWVPGTYIIELISGGQVQATNKAVVIH